MNETILSAFSIPELDVDAGVRVKSYVDSLTVPHGSLGRLEELIIELAEITGSSFPEVSRPGVIVFAADHGVTAEGVSAYPKEVTEQMVRNFLNDGAAINVLSRSIDAYFNIVDIGIDSDITLEGLTVKKVRRGTGNFAKENAMTRTEVIEALEIGYEQGLKMIERGAKCLILGEMGIGNTSASSAIISVVSGEPIDTLVGSGTGLTKERVIHKRNIIEKAILDRKPDPNDPIDLLSKVGGLEIAGMAGAMLAAASDRTPILVDGFISTTAAVVAKLISPRVVDYMFVGHESIEPGHKKAIELIGKQPLINMRMGVGEGTGAAVAFPILKSATLLLKEMATFESAGVSSKTKT
ncbi:nicotinate-nucleotide--dimethylbenzimidazole phosphoribosyltransferase [Halobacillus shinanisalinarum]|uniref:Nicotinate-nucleotide--dimethylbenzimidazole phosphoribosyltransferase n=1 Tax=Halobacillus shinanisalinarum TaxID=2932258 RepID=A0ABY4H2R6_9BACI|nr:nicotinate-nucleotide--dimethylbenzimidazole phosphoribosyltransferase [Halobacillus shinanisalinarum]UOQ94718.1 nicotinate-nucleotide--dimethylbenzimidazole phosphoribosyltransferase [Halobacillus shinanisalinarum]